jgi:hypothetical protein
MPTQDPAARAAALALVAGELGRDGATCEMRVGSLGWHCRSAYPKSAARAVAKVAPRKIIGRTWLLKEGWKAERERVIRGPQDQTSPYAQRPLEALPLSAGLVP